MAQLDSVPATQTAVAAPSGAAFPRVNLLPEEILQQAKVRRAKLVLVGAGLTSAVLIGGLYVMAQSDVAAAQDGLDTATSQATALAAEQATYSEVPQVHAQLDAANAALSTAMSPEVRWSYLLNDLALTIPKNVSLVSYTGQLSAVSAGTTAQAPANTQPPVPGAPGSDASAIGSIQYTGESMTYGNIASWLSSQSKQPTLDNTYLSAATRKDDAAQTGHTVIEFTSTSDLTNKALSHRYDETGN